MVICNYNWFTFFWLGDVEAYYLLDPKCVWFTSLHFIYRWDQRFCDMEYNMYGFLDIMYDFYDIVMIIWVNFFANS